ncbi:MAG: 50S ribosomal protein L6 [Bacteroidota bacterium]
MSRIGKLPILVPDEVDVIISDTGSAGGGMNHVTVKGPLGELSQTIDSCLTVKLISKESNGGSAKLVVERHTEQKRHKSLHGLSRSLLANMIEGVSKGYKKELELVGVGYKISNNGQLLELSLGYSHNIIFELPPEIKLETKTERSKNPVISLQSHDKQLIGHIAAKIRSFKKPEPYKGKGIKYVGEQLRRKAGKAAAKEM